MKRRPEKKIVVTEFLVSEEDNDLAGFKWYPSSGYLKRQDHLPGPVGYLHRIIALREFGGIIPDGFEVDHINQIRHDSRRENLRLVTSHVQKLNMSRQGNVRQRKSGRWSASGGKNIALGTYDTREEALAACARYRAELLEAALKRGDIKYGRVKPGPFIRVSLHPRRPYPR